MKNEFKILEHLSQATILLNNKGEINYFNLKAKELFNVNEPIGLNLTDLIESIGLASFADDLQQVLESVEQTKGYQQMKVETPSQKSYGFKFTSIESGILLEVEVKDCHFCFKRQMLSLIVEHSSDMIFYKNKDLCYQYANPSYLSFLNLDEKQLIGLTDEDLMNQGRLSPILFYQCYESDKEAFENGWCSNIEFSNDKYYEVSKKRIQDGILCIAKEVTNVVNVYQQLELDTLTNFYNRRAFLKMLKANTSEKDYYAIAIMLENLSEITKNEGVVVSNKCLKQIAKLLNDYPDILFFHLEGLGFVGLLEKNSLKSGNLVQQITENVQQLHLPSTLQVEIIVEKLDEHSEIVFSVLSQ